MCFVDDGLDQTGKSTMESGLPVDDAEQPNTPTEDIEKVQVGENIPLLTKDKKVEVLSNNEPDDEPIKLNREESGVLFEEKNVAGSESDKEGKVVGMEAPASESDTAIEDDSLSLTSPTAEDANNSTDESEMSGTESSISSSTGSNSGEREVNSPNVGSENIVSEELKPGFESALPSDMDIDETKSAENGTHEAQPDNQTPTSESGEQKELEPIKSLLESEDAEHKSNKIPKTENMGLDGVTNSASVNTVATLSEPANNDEHIPTEQTPTSESDKQENLGSAKSLFENEDEQPDEQGNAVDTAPASETHVEPVNTAGTESSELLESKDTDSETNAKPETEESAPSSETEEANTNELPPAEQTPASESADQEELDLIKTLLESKDEKPTELGEGTEPDDGSIAHIDATPGEASQDEVQKNSTIPEDTPHITITATGTF